MAPQTKKSSSSKATKSSKTPSKATSTSSSSSHRKKSSADGGGNKSSGGSTTGGKNTSKKSSSSKTPESTSANVLPPSSGYLVTCDVPTKQFIKHLNASRSVDKQFILEDLDATHLLIVEKAREEIMQKVEAWMDQNVFSNVERLGENLET